jgi:hypothetical protein
MPEERGAIRRLEHIPLVREPDIEPEHRRRRYFSRVPARDRRLHGSELEKGYDETVDQLLQERQISGIAPERLLVIEFQTFDSGVRDNLEDRFQLVVVDEGTTDDGRSRLLVQFADIQSLQRFRQEVQRYQAESEVRSDILTQSQRRELFDRIESARALSPEERTGPRLKARGWPQTSTFYLDVDIWHPGNVQHAPEVQQSIRQFCGRFGGRVTDETRTETLLLAKIQANQQLGGELLKVDLVARVELPPEIREASLRVLRDDLGTVSITRPTGEEGRVCILDSGVVAGHPLLQGWVEEERDFDTGEGTEVDLHGHGTQVAGLVVYGDIAECLESGVFDPQVVICSAKVLRRDRQQVAGGLPPDAVFPEEHRIEKTTEDAIRDFHARRGCRVFNLSLGSSDIYYGTRQFAWAEKLDQLVRELDIVIVVSAGNRPDPPIPLAGPGREDFQKALIQQMMAPEQRLCNPATAALVLTVGAIARSDRCRAPDAIPAAPENAPSPFSRVGFGYQISATKRSVKPDCVAHGGNYALQTLGGADKRWVKEDVYLGEPTIALPSGGRFLCAPSGTSFASPHIANIAARAEVALRGIVPVPSANLIRAIVGATTVRPTYPINWIEDEETEGESKLRIVRVRSLQR